MKKKRKAKYGITANVLLGYKGKQDTEIRKRAVIHDTLTLKEAKKRTKQISKLNKEEREWCKMEGSGPTALYKNPRIYKCNKIKKYKLTETEKRRFKKIERIVD